MPVYFIVIPAWILGSATVPAPELFPLNIVIPSNSTISNIPNGIILSIVFVEGVSVNAAGIKSALDHVEKSLPFVPLVPDVPLLRLESYKA